MPISISIRELVTIIPSSMLPSNPKTEEIYRQLLMLEKIGFLEEQNRSGFTEYASFSIRNDGILIVKKIFGDLSPIISDKEVYDRTIDNTEGNSETKSWLKGLWNRLKERSQEEIADEILSGVKKYGPQLVGFLVRVITQGPN